MRQVTKMAMTMRSTRRAPCHGARRRDPMIRIVIILMIAKALYNHPLQMTGIFELFIALILISVRGRDRRKAVNPSRLGDGGSPSRFARPFLSNGGQIQDRWR